MFRIEFYEDKSGKSELWDFLEDLRHRSRSNKNARIEFNQVSLYIQLLSQNGTRMSDNYTKYIGEDIWELRPGSNRVLFFNFKDDTYVLLHYFRKKSQKTPRREIDIAIARKNDYLSRKKGAR
jgi:phage-related protein